MAVGGFLLGGTAPGPVFERISIRGLRGFIMVEMAMGGLLALVISARRLRSTVQAGGQPGSDLRA